MDESTVRRAFDPKENFAQCRHGLYAGSSSLSTYDLLGGHKPTYEAATRAMEAQRALRESGQAPCTQDKAMGCMVGNLIGDALGAPMEFSAVRYGVEELGGMDDEHLWQKAGYNAFSLKPGQWTDDGSMALCIADSLLVHRPATAPARAAAAAPEEKGVFPEAEEAAAPTAAEAAATPVSATAVPEAVLAEAAASTAVPEAVVAEAPAAPTTEAASTAVPEAVVAEAAAAPATATEAVATKAWAADASVERKQSGTTSFPPMAPAAEPVAIAGPAAAAWEAHNMPFGGSDACIVPVTACSREQGDQEAGEKADGLSVVLDPVRVSRDDTGLEVASSGFWRVSSYSQVDPSVVLQWKENERHWLGEQEQDSFPASDVMARFTCWNRYGYNNSFGRDPRRSYRSSVGLGGNISMAMSSFSSQGVPYTRAGTLETSGNGSVMRNGAVPCAFHDDLATAQAFSYRQSKTTHRGEEAAECCRLLAFICCAFIRGGDIPAQECQNMEPEALASRVKFSVLDSLPSLGFHSDLYSITCLSRSEAEQPHPSNAHLQLCDRVWTWKQPDHRFAPLRSRMQPTYIGSYAMDNLAMALHCVYTTSSFASATLKAANLCGDADSVCAVAGQLAGSLYGLSSIPLTWVDRLQAWDGGSIVTRAYLLCDRSRSLPVPPLSPEACRTATLVGVRIGGEDDHWEKMQTDEEYRSIATGRARAVVQQSWCMSPRWLKRRGSSSASSSTDEGRSEDCGVESVSSISIQEVKRDEE